MSDGTGRTPTLDRAIATLASRQHGVVALRQLLRLGLSASAVRMRVAAGRLHRVHRGVYSVGHALLAAKGRWMAAALACGDAAVVSHRTAGHLLGLRQTAARYIDVTSPTRAGRRRPGIRVHAGHTLAPQDAIAVDAVPCTSMARTLLDLAEILEPRQLGSAIERAEALQIFDLRAVNDVLGRSNGRRGAPLLREAIRLYEDTGTRNDFERLFLELCDRAGLPRPLVNVPLGDVVPDFTWPDHRLIVETDGWDTHGPKPARQRDVRRDRKLTAAGWRVVRFTWIDVRHAPDEVVRVLRELFGLR